MGISPLVNLCARAWSLPILAAMDAGVPGRQAPLIAWTGSGRTAFGHSLDHLQQGGWVRRNPGHGHPLRSEFVLTDAGKTMARLAGNIYRQVSRPEDKAVARLSWSVPAIALMSPETRFSDLRAGLAPVTDRALSQTLARLEGANWITRDVARQSRPPRPMAFR